MLSRLARAAPVLLASLAWFASAAARAEEAAAAPAASEAPPPTWDSPFALAVDAGGSGLGVGLRFGSAAYGLTLRAALVPVAVLDQQAGVRGYQLDTLQGTWDLGLSGDLFFLHTQHANLGLTVGYLRNGLLGNGAFAGLGADIALWKGIDLLLRYNIALFPDTVDQLHSHGVATGASDILPVQAGGASVGLIFHR